MIKILKDIKNYCFFPTLESNQMNYDTPLMLFNKMWRIMDDFWMKHIHIKITDKCDASCPFCIEKDSHIKEDKSNLISNLTLLLEQMHSQGHLSTVSITGGEPSLCPYTGIVVDLVKSYPTFLNINTNFHRIINSSSDPDWLNISRHVIGTDAYTGIKALDKSLLHSYRTQHPNTKVRIQCVLHPNGLQSIKEIIDFIDNYIGVVDDLSFRRLINVSNKAPQEDLFQKLKGFLFNNASFVEQVLKDYYVYETWNYKGLNITLSHSDMKLLKDLEQTEDDSILREIVIHPDGLISGSWYRNKKIIHL